MSVMYGSVSSNYRTARLRSRTKVYQGLMGQVKYSILSIIITSYVCPLCVETSTSYYWRCHRPTTSFHWPNLY